MSPKTKLFISAIVVDHTKYVVKVEIKAPLKIIEKTGANSIKEMGKVMGELKQNYSDTVDFSKAGALIKNLLTNK